MLNLQDRILRELGRAPFTADVLKNRFDGLRKPLQKAQMLAESGAIIRLKRGLYCVSPEISGVQPNRMMIANALMGPSYVSAEYALAHYGLIPERVMEVTSVVARRGKNFETPLGRFSFRTVQGRVFPIGVRSRNGVLMAGPEKALCDYLDLRRKLRITSPVTLRDFLWRDVRLDFDAVTDWDRSVFAAYAACGYKTPLFNALAEVFA